MRQSSATRYRSAEDVCSYPDIDLHLAPSPDGPVFTNKKGERY